MQRSVEVRPSIHIQDFRRMERARRLAHSAPDHATKGAPSRSLGQKETTYRVSHRIERVEQKAAEAHIQEAMSEPIVVFTPTHEEAKPKPSISWASIIAGRLFRLTSDGSLVYP